MIVSKSPQPSNKFSSFFIRKMDKSRTKSTFFYKLFLKTSTYVTFTGSLQIPLKLRGTVTAFSIP